jgi:site-specific DNA-methyltransferase (adenine-specific)
MSKLLTTEEAAKYLGVTPSRVRQFILEERLKSEKYGRDHLIRESDLEQFAKKDKDLGDVVQFFQFFSFSKISSNLTFHISTQRIAQSA